MQPLQPRSKKILCGLDRGIPANEKKPADKRREMKLRRESLHCSGIRLAWENPARFESWASGGCGHSVNLPGTHRTNKHHCVAYRSTPHASHTSI
jgi:hypothetical protein